MFNQDTPIFLQIAAFIEDNIIEGIFKEESPIPSITEFSVEFSINPATALKGINLLVERELIYKKRGIRMFVKSGAVEDIRKKRKEDFYRKYIVTLLCEAKRLNYNESEIISLIQKGI
jgi:GntR family transcriptional regulator